MVSVYRPAEVVGGVLKIAFELEGIDAHLEAYVAEFLRRIVNAETVVSSHDAVRRKHA
jgi:hypothetical protein